MKLIRWFQLILSMLLLAACSSKSGNGGVLNLFPPTPTLRSPIVAITSAPDAESAMRNFLEALRNNNFPAMYALLSKSSQQAVTQDNFAKKYNDALNTDGRGQVGLRGDEPAAAVPARPRWASGSSITPRWLAICSVTWWLISSRAGSMAPAVGRQPDPARTGGRQCPEDGLSDSRTRRHL